MSLLDYDELGERRSDRAPLIMFHAPELGGCRGEWLPVAARLAGAGEYALLPDLPGFGDGSVEPRRHDAAEQLTALGEFLAAHGPAVLVGRGHAAAYAVAWAVRSPDLVRALVLLNPLGLGAPRVDDHLFAQLTDRRHYDTLTDDDLVARWLDEDVYFGPCATPEEVVATAARARRPGAQWAVASLLAGYLALDARLDWLAATQPALLLWGEACADPPLVEAEGWLLPLRPDAPFMMIQGEPVGVQKQNVIYRSWPDTRARPHVERADSVAATIAEFVAQLPDSS